MMSLNARFKSQLPFTVQILGQTVTFGDRVDGQVPVDISGSSDQKQLTTAFDAWKSRKGIWIEGPDERANREAQAARLAKPDALREFLTFYITQPVGLRMLILDPAKDLSRYPGRVSAITESLLTWDAVSNWERLPTGKLKFSISCVAYRSRLTKRELEPNPITEWSLSWCLCSSNVSDLSACCGPHKKPGAKTLFTYYPYFAIEGFPELMA